MADAGSDVEELEKTYILYNRTRKFIKNLDDALGRIDDKTYGICKVTGKKIAKRTSGGRTSHSIKYRS